MKVSPLPRISTRTYHLRILRRILLSENVRRGNSSASTPTNQQCTSDTPLHLPNDVVVHVAQQARHIRVRSRHTQEHARIPSPRFVNIGHHAHADDGPAAIEDDDQAALTIPICNPRSGEHPCRGEYVRRERHDLAHCDRIAHIVAEDDGEEVAPRVRNDVVQEIQPRELPDLPVAQVPCNGRPGQLVDHRIAAVALDPSEHNGSLWDREKRSTGNWMWVCRLVWEVDNGDEAEYAEQHGNGALDGENPLPAVEAAEDLCLSLASTLTRW